MLIISREHFISGSLCTALKKKNILPTMIHEVGLLFSLLACGGYLWTNVDPCWKKTSGDFGVQPYDICYGLYKSCTITSVGEWLCDNNLSETPLDLGIPGRRIALYGVLYY